MATTPTKLTKVIRDIQGYKIRQAINPKTKKMGWGIYAGKKLKTVKDTMQDCEAWVQLAVEVSTKANRLKKLEAENAKKPKKEQVFVGNLKKTVDRKEAQLAGVEPIKGVKPKRERKARKK